MWQHLQRFVTLDSPGTSHSLQSSLASQNQSNITRLLFLQEAQSGPEKVSSSSQSFALLHFISSLIQVWEHPWTESDLEMCPWQFMA